MDGYTLKFKARYCVRGDKKTEGVDYFEEYAPVISWSTVLLALTLIFPNGSHTKQVYCTNAFSQSYPIEQVFIEPPIGLWFKDVNNKVLKLIKILYGLKKSSWTLFENLRNGIL